MLIKRWSNLPIWLRFLINLSFITFLAWIFFKFLRDFWFIDYFYEEIIYHMTNFLLHWAKLILELLGYKVEIWGKIIKVNGNNGILLDRGCLGRNVLVTFLVLIWAYPATFKNKLITSILLFAWLMVLNEMRLLALIYIDYIRPGKFWYYHDKVLKPIIFLLMLLFWIIWVNRTIKKS